MKRIATFLFAAMVSVSLVVPAFALPQDVTDYEWQPLVSLSEWNQSESTFLWSSSMVSYRAAGRDVALWPYAVGSNGSINHMGYIDATPGSTGSSYVWEFSGGAYGTGVSSFAISRHASGLDSSFPDTLYYGIGKNASATVSSWSNKFPVFTSDKAAIQYFLDNDPSIEPFSTPVTIPIGYAAFLKASGTLTMRCSFPSNSALFSGTSGWWGETHQTIGSASALPDASFQFPVADALQIIWGRDSILSPLGILGTTKHAYSEHVAFSPWTVIYNPVYKNVSIGANANDPDSFNGPITVSGTIREFRLYPLSSSLSSSGIVGDGNSDDYIDVTIDPDTGEPVYTDPSGNVVTPPSAGGNTALPEAVSNTSLIQRIVGVLSDLVNRVEGIFSVAYQAIINLVGLAGPFVSRLSALYSWLPSPVLSALSSAMILAITIGVLKVFL